MVGADSTLTLKVGGRTLYDAVQGQADGRVLPLRHDGQPISTAQGLLSVDVGGTTPEVTIFGYTG